MDQQESRVIIIPPFFGAVRTGESLAICNELSGSEKNIIVEAKYLVFIDPLGIALLGSVFHSLHSDSIKVKVRGLNAALAGYLERMDVFKDVEVELNGSAKSLNQRYDRGNALVELTRLDNPREVNDVARRLARALVGRMPGIDFNEPPDEMTGQTAVDLHEGPLEYALNELLENSVTHARKYGFKEGSVWVACQYYPAKGTVRLGIVDRGCGFLATLSKHALLREQKHLDAILLALQPRVSCNRDLQFDKSNSVNQGVGLTTTFRIAQQAGGRLIIASGDAIHDTAGWSNCLSEGAFWQGVAISLECYRDRLPSVEIRKLLPQLDAKPAKALRFEE